MIPDDWASPGVATIVERILAQTKSGSIILCHDGNGDNMGQDRLQKLRAAGYQFATISDLLTAEN